ncbi:MAG: hypothetical protein K1X39_01300 [Thermoflexales bacterium]|nr:hypothetical protein [Thermoflexales bacterium]
MLKYTHRHAAGLVGALLIGLTACATPTSAAPAAPREATPGAAATLSADLALAPRATVATTPVATASVAASYGAPVVRSPAPDPAQRIVPTPTGDDVLSRVVAGIEGDFEQGQPIPLTGNVIAEFRITRGREKFPRDLDVFVYRGTPDNIVEDAGVGVAGAMLDMEHASFRLRVPSEGGGHYVLMMPTIMPGRWTLDITVKVGDKETTTRLVLETFD